MAIEHWDRDAEWPKSFETELAEAISGIVEMGGCTALRDFESFDALEDNPMMLERVGAQCGIDLGRKKPVMEKRVRDGNALLKLFQTKYPGVYVGRYEFVCNDGYLVWTIQDLDSEY